MTTAEGATPKNLIARAFVKNGAHPNSTLEFYAGTTVIIGRAHDHALCVADETVSRRHAELSAELGGIYFRNFGRNGSLVNNKTIYDSERLVLQDGAVIGIGACELCLQMLAREETQIISHTMILPLRNDLNKTMILSPLPQAREENRQTPTAEKDKNNRRKNSTSKRTAMAQLKTRLHEWRARLPKSRLAKMCLVLIGLLLALHVVTPLKGGSKGGELIESQPRNEPATILELVEPQIQGTAPEDEHSAALIFLRSAKKLFDERELRRRNLYDGIRKWREGLNMLGRYSQRPAEYAEARDKYRLATRLLERHYEEWKAGVVIHLRKKEFKKAQQLNNIILEAIPDINDARYRWAKEHEPRILVELN